MLSIGPTSLNAQLQSCGGRCLQEKWAYFWLEVKLEVGMGLADSLAESLGYVWWHTRQQDRTNLLLPALIFEQYGPFMRCAVELLPLPQMLGFPFRSCFVFRSFKAHFSLAH